MLFSVNFPLMFYEYFFFNNTPPPEIYTLSLHELFRSRQDLARARRARIPRMDRRRRALAPFHVVGDPRSEEHTSELQSHSDLVCRLLLEKKKKHITHYIERILKETNDIRAADYKP